MYVKTKRNAAIATGVIGALGSVSSAAVSDTVTFDGDFGGFNVSGGFHEFVDDGIGNTHLRSVAETFGMEWWTDRNDSFLGDYTAHDQITLSIDLRVDTLQFFGQDTTRSVVVELRNSRYRESIFQYASVWFVLDREFSSANNSEWETFSVTFDPNAVALPEGWGGYGGSDDADGPVLPDGVGFNDILSNVDQLVFSTLVPVERYPFTNFDIHADNISISTIPAPGAAALLGLGGLVGARRRR